MSLFLGATLCLAKGNWCKIVKCLEPRKYCVESELSDLRMVPDYLSFEVLLGNNLGREILLKASINFACQFSAWTRLHKFLDILKVSNCDIFRKGSW
jgi:hypothetical protein